VTNTPVPAFAPPPKTPTRDALPTSTFIPNLEYHQAGFSAPPLTPVTSKFNDDQIIFYQEQPALPAPVNDIIILNPSANDKSLIAFSSDVKAMAQQYGQNNADASYQMNTMGGVPPPVPTHFDAPPTDYADHPPAHQPQQMDYQPQHDIPNGANGTLHAPGQVAHPNQVVGPQSFKYGLFSCFGDMSACCLGCCCPGSTYSKTRHRLKTRPNSNLDDYERINPMCLLWWVAAPLAPVLTMIQRSKIRETYQIKGSVCSDFCASCFCLHCVLIQNERQVKEAEEERMRCSGPSSGMIGEQGYKKPEKMSYQRSSVIG